MVFPFEKMHIDAGGSGPWDIAEWNLDDFRTVTKRWQSSLDGGWIGLYLANHDQPRIVTPFGDENFRVESATMRAPYLFTLRETPFVYQGQELGMTNPPFESWRSSAIGPRSVASSEPWTAAVSGGSGRWRTR